MENVHNQKKVRQRVSKNRELKAVKDALDNVKVELDEVREKLDYSEACYLSIKNTFLNWVLESDSIQDEKEMLKVL